MTSLSTRLEEAIAERGTKRCEGNIKSFDQILDTNNALAFARLAV